MRRTAGQAVRLAFRHAGRGGLRWGGRSLILVGRVALALALLVAIGVGALAWRLSRGPIDLPWVARQIAAAASEPSRVVAVGHVLVSWAGFVRSDAPPLQLRLDALSATGDFGSGKVARIDIAVPLAPLLTGRIEPDTADITGVTLHLATPKPGRGTGGGVDPAQLLHLIATPSDGPDRAWARLRHLRLHQATVNVEGAPGRVAALDIDLDRGRRGGLTGRATARLTAADQEATLTLAAQVGADGQGTELQGALTPISPASLAGAAPDMAPLAALAAPVTLTASAALGPTLGLVRAEASISIGAGTIHAGTGTAPLLGADLRLDATPDAAHLRVVRLDTAAPGSDQRTRFTGEATARQENPGYAMAATLAVDQVDFAHLAVLWPEGTGGNGARPWMTENITAGRVQDGHLELDLTFPADLSDVGLKRIAGSIDGHDLTVHWLRPVPPLEHGEAKLTCTDADVIDIAVASAVQGGGSQGGMQYHDSTIHLTGIAGTAQFAEIHTGLAGPLPDLLAVLNNPGIQLLSKRPLPMRDPKGQIAAQLHVGRLPLRADVAMDDLVIDTTAHATGVFLGGIAAGFDLGDGVLDLAANNDGMTIDGSATLATFPSKLKIGMDFRAGPPTQVQQTVSARSVIDLTKLSTIGIATGPELGGSATLETKVTARRDGRTDIALDADLTQASFAEPRMGVEKPAGAAGSASAKVAIQGDKLVSIGSVRVEAPGISVAGDAEVTQGAPSVLRLDRLVLGSGTNLSGEVRLMDGPEKAIGVSLKGPSLDLSPLMKPSGKSDGGGGGQGMGGRPWNASLAADRVILGEGRGLDQVRAEAESDGKTLRRGTLQGRVAASGGPAPFNAAVTPDAGGRRLTIEAADLGAVLKAADVTAAVIGGRLKVTGRFADKVAGAPLSGVAEMNDFRIRDAPAIGRVLQGLTVYGLLELAQGPGLGFSEAVVPFSLERRVLGLNQAHAFSASLGFTATGRIDLGRRTADLSGTVVPAYFFNSLLGRVPLVGRLFSAERGGGLFAAAVQVRGPLDDLSVSVNPLSAITPGFLRGLFGTNAPPSK